MSCLPMFKRGRRLPFLPAAAVALVVLLPAMPVVAADMDAAAKVLATLDDDWSTAAARDADRMASFCAEDAIAYPPNEPVAMGPAAARKV
jgi:hypothetical protein